MSLRSPGRPVLICLFAVLLMTVGCAAGNERWTESPAGFFAGLWHGFILLFAFVVSLFNDAVRVYEANNGGNIYNLGFVLGVSMFFGGGFKVHISRRGRKKDD